MNSIIQTPVLKKADGSIEGSRRIIPEGKKISKVNSLCGTWPIFCLTWKRKANISPFRTKWIDFHGATRKVWCIWHSAPEGSAAVFFVYTLWTMKSCMIIKLCRIHQPFCYWFNHFVTHWLLISRDYSLNTPWNISWINHYFHINDLIQ